MTQVIELVENTTVVEVVEGTTTVIEVIAAGPQGRPGLVIKGMYASMDLFLAAHPAGSDGDAYIVDGNLVVWLDDDWVTIGPVIGSSDSQFVVFDPTGTDLISTNVQDAIVEVDTNYLAAIAAEASARSSADTAHASAPDPHPGYLTSAEGNAAYDALGAADDAQAAAEASAAADVADHAAASDPHPTYTTASELAAAIASAISGLINGAPGALDTLNELGAALGDDPNFATTIVNALAGKLATAAHTQSLHDTTLGLATDAELAAHVDDVANAHAASAVGFTPTGTISSTDVQAAIAEVAGDVVPGSVMFQGVNDWNGTTGTENHVALQAAIDALPAGGGNIWVDGNAGPAGGYYINHASQVNFNKPNITFVGIGPAKIVLGPLCGSYALNWTGAQGRFLFIELDTTKFVSTTALGITGDDFEWGWGRQKGAVWDGYEPGRVKVQNGTSTVYRPRFHDIYIDTAPSPNFVNTVGGGMEDLYFVNYYLGVYLVGTKQTFVRRNWFMSTRTRQEASISTSTWYDIGAPGNPVPAAKTAVFTFATAPAVGAWIAGHKVTVASVTGQTGYNNIHGVAISYVSPDGLTVGIPLSTDPGGAGDAATGTMLSASIGADAIISTSPNDFDSQGISITENHVLSCREHGIYFADHAARNVLVDGNIFSGVSRDCVKFFTSIGDWTTGVTITNNIMGPGENTDPVNSSNVAVYLIHVKNCLVEGNDMSFPVGSASGGNQVFLDGACQEITIRGNQFGPNGRGIGVMITDTWSTVENFQNIHVIGNDFKDACQYTHDTFTNYAPIRVLIANSGGAHTFDGLIIADNTCLDLNDAADFAVYLANTTAATSNVIIGPNYGHGQATGFYYVGSGWDVATDQLVWYLGPGDELMSRAFNTWAGDQYWPGAQLASTGNMLKYSEDFTQSEWTKNVSSGDGTAPAIGTGVTDPDGGTTACSYTQHSTSGGTNTLSQYLSSVGASLLGRTFTVSLYVQGVGGTIGKKVSLRLDDGSTEVPTVVGTTLTSGWVRLTFTHQFTVSTLTSMHVVFWGSGLAVNDVVNITRFQLQESATPGTYTPTTTAAVVGERGLVVTGRMVASGRVTAGDGLVTLYKAGATVDDSDFDTVPPDGTLAVSHG